MRTLQDLDVNYKRMSENISNEEKLNYCNDIIDRFQNIIEKNRAYLSERVKNEFSELIGAAQGEIVKIKGN
jgi:dihydroneopterin aldolase